MKKGIRGFVILFCITMIILDGDTTAEGVKQGLEVCQKAVIPALFPLLVLCSLLTGCNGGILERMISMLCRICHIPSGAAGILLAGLIGGYPAGARSIEQSYTSGQAHKYQAERLLPLCNQCGPAFLFGMVRSSFGSLWICWCLWIIQLLSMISTARLLSPCGPDISSIQPSQQVSMSSAMRSAIGSIAQICGWVICFRILICFLDRWVLWSLPIFWRTVIIGTLELSNGCLGLPLIENEQFRFILCSCLLSFGGLCVTMQTFSVIPDTLDKRYYLKGKLLQSFFSMLISVTFCWCLEKPHLALMASLIVLSVALAKKVMIRSRFSRPIHV